MSILLLIALQNSSTSSLSMELSGGSGANSYVAVGFAPAAQMQNADVYYCTGTALKSAYIGTRYSDPVVDGSLPVYFACKRRIELWCAFCVLIVVIISGNAYI